MHVHTETEEMRRKKIYASVSRFMVEFDFIVFISTFPAELAKEKEQERRKRRRRRKATRRTEGKAAEAKSTEIAKQTNTQNATVPKSTPTQATAPAAVTAQQPSQPNHEDQNSQRPIFVVINPPMYPAQMNAMESCIPPDHQTQHHGPEFPPYQNRYPHPHHQNWPPHRLDRPMGPGPSNFPPQFYRPPRLQPRFDAMHRPYSNHGPFNNHGQFNNYGPYSPYNNNNNDIRHSGAYYNNNGSYGGSYGQTRYIQVFPTEPLQPQPQLPPPGNPEQTEELPKKKKKKKKRKKKKKNGPVGAEAEGKTDGTIQATGESTVQDATPSTSKQGNFEKHAELEKHSNESDSD